MTPRKFYLGFGPPLVKKMRGKVEYGIGALPLGGYVKIPGMSRPSPGDLKATLPVGACGRRTGPSSPGSTPRSRAATYDEASAELAALRPALGESGYVQELAWSLEPDAYWRQATWRRLVAIGAGPGINLLVRVRAVRDAVHDLDDAQHERDRAGREGLAGRCRRPARR